jgi:CelD/BcsL family acetyltransferase involved in cellulose biosynthesis
MSDMTIVGRGTTLDQAQRTSGMNALICPAQVEAVVRSNMVEANRVARIDVFDNLQVAEPIWRALEGDGALATPYQRYDWILAWQIHIGARNGITPFLVVGRDLDGTPLFLWPLGTRRIGPITIAGFLGGRHTNFNLALWRRDLAATISVPEIQRIFKLMKISSRVDLLVLTNQPKSWDGLPNPLLKLTHQASPSHGLRGRLAGDFEALLREQLDRTARRKWRQKQAGLAAHGPIRFWRVETVADVRLVLDAFFSQKAQRMHELGLADRFSTPGTRDFIEAAATERLAQARPAIELYACAVGDQIVATYGGVVGGGRFCGVFTSMIRGELARKSPGQLLMINLVRMCCQRGLTQFDLGVGEARFKRLFCTEIEPLFDTFRPLSARGSIAALGYRLGYHLKARIKSSPPIWDAVTTLRRRLRSWYRPVRRRRPQQPTSSRGDTSA